MLTAAYKWNTIKIRISLKWIQKRNVPMTNVDDCISFNKKKRFSKKNCTGRCRDGRWGHTLVAVAVVERWPLYGLSAGTKKCGRCREVAVCGGSTVYILKQLFTSVSLFTSTSVNN